MKTGNEQPDAAGSFQFLEICCRYIEEKYDNDRIESWTNGDYVRLSAQILRETSTLVSANTLKRIFGKISTPSRYYPQQATRDALARYAGFADWQGLQTAHEAGHDTQAGFRPPRLSRSSGSPRLSRSSQPSQPSGLLQPPGPSGPPEKRGFGKRTGKRIGGGILLLFGLLLISLWLWSKLAAPETTTGDVALVCENPVGGNPHSAVFKLAIPEGFRDQSASFSLLYGDGKTESMDLNNRLITHYYEIPGRYYATLKRKETILDTVPVYLKTEDWTATATMMYDTTRVYPVIRTPLFRNGAMMLRSKDLHNAGIDTNQTFFVHYVLSKPLGISGDNFLMTADVKASPPRPGIRCSQLVVTLFGDKTDHNFFIIKPGCVTWSGLRFSEKVKVGKYNDLSFLGADLTNGGTFKLKVADQSVSLWINNSLVHETRYKVPLKEIKGIKFAFAGIGYVNRVSLRDLESGKTYANDFSFQLPERP